VLKSAGSKIATLLAALMLVLGSVLPAAAAEWQRYVHPGFGFAIDLPVSGYVRDEGAQDRLTLRDDRQGVQIDVFGVRNDSGMSLREFATMIVAADPSRRITYRAGGNRWFVISGYLGDGDTIFYAKFLVNRAGTQLSAFEISYPQAAKRRLDRLVTRIEKSLSSPRG